MWLVGEDFDVVDRGPKKFLCKFWGLWVWQFGASELHVRCHVIFSGLDMRCVVIGWVGQTSFSGCLGRLSLSCLSVPLRALQGVLRSFIVASPNLTMPAPAYIISRVADPIFALVIGVSAAAMRINREETAKGYTTQQTIDNGLR